jgi:hypothetical protein
MSGAALSAGRDTRFGKMILLSGLLEERPLAISGWGVINTKQSSSHLEKATVCTSLWDSPEAHKSALQESQGSLLDVDFLQKKPDHRCTSDTMHPPLKSSSTMLLLNNQKLHKIWEEEWRATRTFVRIRVRTDVRMEARSKGWSNARPSAKECKQPLESRKSTEMTSPEPLGGVQLCWPVLYSWPPER